MRTLVNNISIDFTFDTSLINSCSLIATVFPLEFLKSIVIIKRTNIIKAVSYRDVG